MKTLLQILFFFVFISGSAQKFSTPNMFNTQKQKVGMWSEDWNGFVFIGEYIRGKKEGSWVHKNGKGKVDVLYTFKNDSMHGQFLKLNLGFIEIQGYYKEGSMYGNWKTYNENQVLLKNENYVNGKLHGRISLYHSTGELLELTNYENGKRIGESLWYNQKGFVIARYNYVNGKKQGEQFTYFKNGNSQTKSTYVNDKLNGVYESYYKNGLIKEKGSYKDDKKIGDWKQFDEKGKQTK